MTSKNDNTKPASAAPEELTAEELDQAQGGLLPAVQKVRAPAKRNVITDGTSNITDGTSNTVAGDGSV